MGGRDSIIDEEVASEQTWNLDEGLAGSCVQGVDGQPLQRPSPSLVTDMISIASSKTSVGEEVDSWGDAAKVKRMLSSDQIAYIYLNFWICTD